MLGELNREQIEDVLRRALIGRIGCVVDGKCYVVPVSYAYDGEHVYAHSGEGLKIRAMRASPRVCFEVEEMDNLANWRSVIAWGTYEELHDQGATKAMEQLMSRFLPLMASETAHPSHGLGAPSPHRQDTGGKKAVLYRIRLDEKSGRFEKR